MINITQIAADLQAVVNDAKAVGTNPSHAASIGQLVTDAAQAAGDAGVASGTVTKVETDAAIGSAILQAFGL